MRDSEYNQPIGDPLEDFQAAKLPHGHRFTGRTATVEPLAEKHLDSLVASLGGQAAAPHWTYMSQGPFDSDAALREFLSSIVPSTDPYFFAVVEPTTGQALGFLSLMRHQPEHGVIEVGWVTFGPRLQRSTATTEAQFLLMSLVFEDLGYRRYEWKCDALNADSRRAATRLGFTYEGTFRQAIVYKGRNRDTAWYSIIDSEWPSLKARFAAWLDPANFDSKGNQRVRLQDIVPVGSDGES